MGDDERGELSSGEVSSRIDGLLDEFERAWNSGQQPRIEPLVDSVEADHFWPLLRELIALDLHYRALAGCPLPCEDYEQRFPRQRDLIRRMFGETAVPDGPMPPKGEASPAATFDVNGRRISRLKEYDLLEEIGSGGMGHVFRARHRLLGKVVAIKVPKDRETVVRFRRELECIGQLQHPHLANATDANLDDIPYLVMEHVDGLNLRELIHAVGPLSVADAAELCRQAALGLEHAHQQGLVHRDVKPGNLMLDAAGVVKLLDLGLARAQAGASTDDKDLTGRQIVGTLPYMAPEQARDARTVDIRSDLYSLGCTLYYLLTGHAPYVGTETSVLVDHQTAPIPDVREERADAPASLASLLECLLAKNRDDRPATPADLVVMLSPFVEGCDLVRLIRLARAAGRPTSAGEDRPTVAYLAAPVTQPEPASPKSPSPGTLEATPTSEEPDDSGRRSPRRFVWWGIAAAACAALALVLSQSLGLGTSRAAQMIDMTTVERSPGWQTDPSAATSASEPLAWLRLPVAGASWQLDFAAERLTGQQLLIVHVDEEFPWTVQFGAQIIRADEGAGEAAESRPDSSALIGRWGEWNDDRPRQLQVQFGTQGLEVYRDGESIIEASISQLDFAPPPPRELPETPGVYLCAQHSQFRIRDVRVQMQPR
jgi:serine/threonine protein kinase